MKYFYFLFFLLLLGCTSSDLVPEDCLNQLDSPACDFSLKDQNRNEVSLYDYYGQVILLDLSAMWCGPCQAAAEDASRFAKGLGENFTYLSVIVEDEQGDNPTSSDIQFWAENFKIDMPVLVGHDGLINGSPKNSWDLEYWPTFYIMDDEMVVRYTVVGWSPEPLEARVKYLLELRDR